MNKSPIEEMTAAEMQNCSFALYAVSVIVLIAGFWRIASIDASAIESLIASLLVLNLAAIGGLAGLLFPLAIHRLQVAYADDRARGKR